MAQAVITKLLDGPRNAILHVFFEGDGSGELTDFVIADPATSFDPALPAEPTLTVEKLQYDLVGFNAKLEFDYLTSDTPVWALAGGRESKVDFCKAGGIRDRSNSMDGLGKLKITTSGLEDGDFGSLLVYLRKN
jgi:hypothetical protein